MTWIRLTIVLTILATLAVVGCDDGGEDLAADTANAADTGAVDTHTDLDDTADSSPGDSSEPDLVDLLDSSADVVDTSDPDAGPDLEHDLVLDYGREQTGESGVFSVAWNNDSQGLWIEGRSTSFFFTVTEVATGQETTAVGPVLHFHHLLTDDEKRPSVMPGLTNFLVFAMTLAPYGPWQLDVDLVRDGEVADRVTFFIDVLPAE